jgi:signal transduction histidine kinase
LSLARDVVERHGGKISVDSRPGSGTRFLIELRRDPPPVEAPG